MFNFKQETKTVLTKNLGQHSSLLDFKLIAFERILKTDRFDYISKQKPILVVLWNQS